MKRLLFHFSALFALTFFLNSCASDDFEFQNQSDFEDSVIEIPEGWDSSIRFYGVASPPLSSTKGLIQSSKTWKSGEIIKYKFLNLPPGSGYDIIFREAADEWESHANIQFEEVTGSADVRISFSNFPKMVTWSYTGTDCKLITNQSVATANIASWTPFAPTDVDKKGDALRLLGQILGLELEFRHSNANPDWFMHPITGDPIVKQIWESQIFDMVWQDLRKYVFDPINTVFTETADYDYNSIMNWPFHVHYGSNLDVNVYKVNALSEIDKDFIGKIYPPLLTVKLIAQSNLEFLIHHNSPISIDWGMGNGRIPYSHNTFPSYVLDSEYVVRVFGSNTAISTFISMCSGLTYLDASNNINMNTISVASNKIEDLIAINTPRLSTLSFSYNQVSDVSTLDLANKPLLVVFWAGLNLIEDPLDFSNCPAIETVIIPDNLLTSTALYATVLTLQDRNNLPFPLNITNPNPRKGFFGVSDYSLSPLLGNYLQTIHWEISGYSPFIHPCQ